MVQDAGLRTGRLRNINGRTLFEGQPAACSACSMPGLLFLFFSSARSSLTETFRHEITFHSADRGGVFHFSPSLVELCSVRVQAS